MTIREIHRKHIILLNTLKRFSLRVFQSRLQEKENNVQQTIFLQRRGNLRMTEEILLSPNPSSPRQHQRKHSIGEQIFWMKNLHKLQDCATSTASKPSRIVSLGPRVMVRPRNRFHSASYLYQRACPPMNKPANNCRKIQVIAKVKSEF